MSHLNRTSRSRAHWPRMLVALAAAVVTEASLSAADQEILTQLDFFESLQIVQDLDALDDATEPALAPPTRAMPAQSDGAVGSSEDQP